MGLVVGLGAALLVVGCSEAETRESQGFSASAPTMVTATNGETTEAGTSGVVDSSSSGSGSGEAPTTEPAMTEPATTEAPTTGPGTTEAGTTEVSTTEAGTTGPAPVCGDGMVDAGEQCDDANDVDADACTNVCKLAVCGDGVVGPGEACDDGNQVDDDECNNSCAQASCGDAKLAPGEQCDDGNQVNTDACPETCLNATCGDGFTLEGEETCDDKMESKTCDADCTAAACGDKQVNEAAGETCDDGVETNVCDKDCTAVSCGDGLVNVAAAEECDDGNMVDGDGCEKTCKKTVMAVNKIVFVSSQMFTGNMGGLAGADAKCQNLAAVAKLPGTYMAWLSDNTGSPSTRMTKSAVPYVRADGTKVANNWADLIDGGLLVTLDMTESKGAMPLGNTSCAGGGFKTVWTNTNPNGTLGNGGNSCNNWGATDGGSAWGKADMLDGSWTGWCSGGLCSWLSPIYCVQQ